MHAQCKPAGNREIKEVDLKLMSLSLLDSAVDSGTGYKTLQSTVHIHNFPRDSTSMYFVGMQGDHELS